MASCKQEHESFSLVVVIGHSNQMGLRLTADTGVLWKSFAQWVEPFRPKQMVLLALDQKTDTKPFKGVRKEK